MGIVERTLAEFELSGFGPCYIEYNVNGTVHLHMGGLRVEFSTREFAHVAAVLTRAREELLQQKDFDGVVADFDGAVVFDGTD